MRIRVQSLALLSGLRIPGCGIDRRFGLDPALLWLWRRLVAVALMRPLAWELPYAMSVALKKKRKKKPL